MTNAKPYRGSSKKYLRLGWKPLPVEGKFPPVKGATGTEGTVTPEKVADWRETHGDWNVGLRAEGWVAIDVDHYGEKTGADTLAEWEARLGKLPPTYRSTARGIDNPSGQRFYQVPEDTLFVKGIGTDIDIVQRSHRYSMVAPSVHPNGQPYRWYDPKGVECDPPELIFCPPLPGAWIDALTREPQAALLSGVDVVPWRQLAEDFPTGDVCLAVEVYRAELDDLAGKGHIGHDDALRLALRGFMLGREGHTGAAEPLSHLHRLFAGYIATQRDRDSREADFVFRDMADMAQRKLIAETCRCPRPGELTDEDLSGVVDPNLAFLLAADPLLPRNGNPVNLEAAAAQFTHEHPVRRHRGSNTAVYLWTGDRWEVEDVAEYVYRWLARKVTTEFTSRKADELTRYILTHAPLIDDSDLDTRYISCANGLLEWQTGELRKRTRDIFVVNHVPWAWKPESRPGRFMEWLRTAIEPAQQGAIWEVLGYALSPIHDLKVALALTGPGGGGKSTFVNVVTSLVGGGNCSALAPADLTRQFSPSLLFGKTVNAVGDVGAETLTNLGMFKAIVAGDEISADRKYKDPFRFRPRAFNLASFNVLPAVEQNDSAFWDRWLVLAFQHRFNRSTPDNYFRDRMPYDPKVMEGVLVEAVRGLQRLRERGTFDPDVFGPAKEEWRARVDSIAGFVAEHLAIDPSGLVPGQALFEHYSRLTSADGGKPRKRNNFYADLMAYLDERYPGRAGRVSPRPGVAVAFYGFKVILDSHPNELGAWAPSAAWGSGGWTKRVA